MNLYSDPVFLDLLKNNNGLVIDNKRYYYQSFYSKNFDLESTTPYLLKIPGKEFKTNSWVGLITDVCTYFYNHGSLYFNKSWFLNFECDWSDTPRFKTTSSINWRKIGEGLYVNCNNTALHAFWFVRDLLKSIVVDLSRCVLIIKRPPGAESQEIRNYIEETIEPKFHQFLIGRMRLTEKMASSVINNINIFNKHMSNVSRAYDNFYLFESVDFAKRYRDSFIKFLSKRPGITEHNIEVAERSINYLIEFLSCKSSK